MVKCMRRCTGYALLFLLLCQTDVLAHWTNIFVSTPYTPPGPLIWLIPVSVILIAGGQALSLRHQTSVRTANILLVAIFLQGICLLALLGTGMIQKELVGGGFRFFAIGYQPFYGLEWEDIRVRFLIENWFSAFILLCSTAFLHYWYGISDTGIKIRTQFVSLVIYFMCLIPISVTGAFTHGWGGLMACRHNLLQLGRAMKIHAKLNDGQIPKAKNIEDLYCELRRYLDDTEPKHVLHCGVQDMYKDDPVSYRWNPDASGVSLASAMNQDPPLLLISCPYHSLEDKETRYYALYASDFPPPEEPSTVRLKTAERMQKKD